MTVCENSTPRTFNGSSAGVEQALSVGGHSRGQFSQDEGVDYSGEEQVGWKTLGHREQNVVVRLGQVMSRRTEREGEQESPVGD